LNFYKHHLGDYAAATSHLSWDEDCAYRRLIDQYYKREAPIPVEIRDVHRLVRANTSVQKKAVGVVLNEFFDLAPDGWHQKRCDMEIDQSKSQALINREIAEKRESKRRARTVHEPLHESLDESSTVTYVEREPSHKPLAISHKPVLKDSQPTAERDSPLNGNGAHRIPACPIDEIIQIYHAEIPVAPRVTVRNSKRDKLISGRWRQVFADGKAHSKDEAVRLFQEFFSFVRDSKFLTGRAAAAKDRTPFIADLEWLMAPTNFAKTVEGRYHR
jgi:uncharacterized protein YdaU (DUF1376 family)